jgi:hypothetical protein
MAFIMVTSTFPPHKSEDVGKLFTSNKLPETADFVKRINIFVLADEKTKVYALYEVPNDKFFDGMVSVATRYAGYRAVEHFEYKIESLLTVREALPMIGLG